MHGLLLVLCLLLVPLEAQGQVLVQDDLGRSVSLDRPAKRIVSLAPSITEMLYAAGAGSKIVGAVDYSDYPKEALKIPRVGGAGALDVERIASLKPDLVVAWKSGNPSGQIDKIKSLGLPVFYAEPRRLADIDVDIKRLGVLAGSPEQALQAATAFGSSVAALRSQYSKKKVVSVFYEVWPSPLMTVNDSHIISEVLHLCGATNVFGKLPMLTPTVSTESVIVADPQAIVSSGPESWLNEWKKWDITAAREGHLFHIPSDFISRPSPRIIEGARLLCSQIDAARIK